MSEIQISDIGETGGCGEPRSFRRMRRPEAGHVPRLDSLGKSPLATGGEGLFFGDGTVRSLSNLISPPPYRASITGLSAAFSMSRVAPPIIRSRNRLCP